MKYPTPPPFVTRSRIAVLVVFTLTGIINGAWLARMPTVAEMLGVSLGQLGLLLICGAVGSLCCVPIAGVIVTRIGVRRSMYAPIAAFAIGYVLLGVGPALGQAWIFGLGELFIGSAFGLVNVPLNVESAAIERRVGRAILSQFHAAYSLGAVVGAGIGALTSKLGIPFLALMISISIVGTVVRLWALSRFLPDAETQVVKKMHVSDAAPDDGLADTGPRRRFASLRTAVSAWTERRTLMIGIVLFAASMSEGSANNWVSIAVVDGFRTEEWTGSVCFGLFLAAMTGTRLAGTVLLGRFGRVPVLRYSAVSAAVGLVMFGIGPNLIVVALGAVLWGIGSGLNVPISVSAASDEPLKAAARVSVVSSFGSVASLTMPPLLGLLATSVGARSALLTIIALIVLAFCFSPAAKPLPGSVAADAEESLQRDRTLARAGAPASD